MRLVPIGWFFGASSSAVVRLAHRLADLVAHELGRRVVRLAIQDQIVERRHEVGAAGRPALLVDAPPLLFGNLQRGDVVRVVQDAGAHVPRLLAPRGILGLPRLRVGFGHRAVARWDAEVRRALEHAKLCRLLRDHRHRLDRRRTRADHADAQSGEVDSLVRPMASVIGLASEALDAWEIGQACGGQAAGGHDAVARGHLVAAIGADVPPMRRAVEPRRRHAGVEPDVASQVKAVGDVIGVAQDLRLRGKQLAPPPLLLEFRRERVGVPACSRRRSVHRDSGSSTRCRRRRCRPRTRAPTGQDRAAGAARRGRRIRRRR